MVIHANQSVTLNGFREATGSQRTCMIGPLTGPSAERRRIRELSLALLRYSTCNVSPGCIHPQNGAPAGLRSRRDVCLAECRVELRQRSAVRL